MRLGVNTHDAMHTTYTLRVRGEGYETHSSKEGNNSNVGVLLIHMIPSTRGENIKRYKKREKGRDRGKDGGEREREREVKEREEGIVDQGDVPTHHLFYREEWGYS